MKKQKEETKKAEGRFMGDLDTPRISYKIHRVSASRDQTIRNTIIKYF